MKEKLIIEYVIYLRQKKLLKFDPKISIDEGLKKQFFQNQ